MRLCIHCTLLLKHSQSFFYFQPKLSKCIVDGIDVPLHKARSYVAMEVKVHLHDRDGEPCSGQHLVSLHCETDEQVFTEANSSTPGTYSLSYTPSFLGERSLVNALQHVLPEQPSSPKLYCYGFSEVYYPTQEV